MPRAFGDDERVAAEDNGDVVMPAGKRASLEVVEAEFALEFLVGVLGSPASLESTNDALLAHASGQAGERELGRL